MIKNWILLFAYFLVLSACADKKNELSAFIKSGAFLREVGKEVTINYSDSGVIRANIYAPELVRVNVQNPYIDMTKGVKASFFDPKGNLNSSLTANFARRYEVSRKLLITGNVVLINTKGDTLNTESLIWEEGLKKLHTKKYVRISRKDQVIFGDGLESNQDFTQYKIINIRFIINVKH